MPGNDNEDRDEIALTSTEDIPPPSSAISPDIEALTVALILAPATYSRNKFFSLFQTKAAADARRRAGLIRSLVTELTEPWPHSSRVPKLGKPEISRKVREDGFLEIVVVMEEFGYRRTAMLGELEGHALDYALHRAGFSPLAPKTKEAVESTLVRLGNGWLSDSSE